MAAGKKFLCFIWPNSILWLELHFRPGTTSPVSPGWDMMSITSRIPVLHRTIRLPVTFSTIAPEEV